ncbi:CBS domain-containing protein [Myxococcota bacterium]|nr:CBS domain-containing protein [Myxococcota bacterium]
MTGLHGACHDPVAMYEFLSWRVADVMTRAVQTLSTDAAIRDAEALFDAHDFDALPVVSDEGGLAGIVSKLDVLRAYVFTSESIVPRYDEIRKRPVRTIMTLQPLTIAPDQPLTRALEMLAATRVKSLPVVEQGRLVGIVAREDVIRALRRAAARESPPRA